MTEGQRLRVLQSIKETQTLLDKELSYSVDYRNHIQIAFLAGHIMKLNSMLKE
jgi:hypothetical protein